MAMGIITAPFVFTTFLWPESPRWLYLKGKIGQAESVMSTFIRRTKPSLVYGYHNLWFKNHNLIVKLWSFLFFEQRIASIQVNFESEQDFLDQLRDQVDGSADIKEDNVDESGTFGALVTTSKDMTKITLNVAFQFIGVTMAYYGLVYGAGKVFRDWWTSDRTAHSYLCQEILTELLITLWT